MRSLLGLILASGVLLYLKLDQASGRLRSLERQSRGDCNYGDCTKKMYPWFETLYKKQEPLLLLNKMDQRRFNQPYFDYFSNPKLSHAQIDNNNILIDSTEQQLAPNPEMLKTFQYLQDHASDIQQTWQDNEGSDNNSNVIMDTSNTEIMDDNVNNSMAKRTFYRNRNDYDAFLALAGLGRNFSLENMKHTRGHAALSEEKLKNVEKSNCTCSPQSNVVDLGKQYFPRFHMTYDCIPTSCSIPFFSCKEKLFKIWVLKKREEGDLVGERNIAMLPESLKKDYWFVERWISVACECAI